MVRIRTILLLILAVIALFIFNFTSDTFAYSQFEYSSNKLVPKFIDLDKIDIEDAATILPNLSEEEKIKLFNLQNISSGDLIKSLKSVAILAINLFLIVIQVVAGILKALLPFLV